MSFMSDLSWLSSCSRSLIWHFKSSLTTVAWRATLLLSADKGCRDVTFLMFYFNWTSANREKKSENSPFKKIIAICLTQMLF